MFHAAVRQADVEEQHVSQAPVSQPAMPALLPALII